MPPKKGPEPPGSSGSTGSDSSQIEFEHDMDPELREDILKLFDKSFDEFPEAERETAETKRNVKIERMILAKDKVLLMLFRDEVTGHQNAKKFFGKKSSMFTKPQLEGLESHFSSEYRRTENVVAVREIIDIYLRDSNTLNFAPLVQPSMSGKSRLVSELAKSVPTIYACFRENKSTGYPKCTRVSMQFFQRLLTIEKRADREANLVHYFWSIVRKLESMKLQEKDYGDLWKSQAEGEKSFFDESPIENMRQPSEDEIGKAWRKYSQGLGSRVKKSKLKLLMVFDEARFLLTKTKDVSLIRNIRRALHTLQSLMPGMFILFVDTTLHVADFSPSAKHEVSQRYSKSEPDSMRLNAPIYTFDTFDVFNDHRTVSLSDVGSEKSYLCMGRPGWGIFELTEVPEIAKDKILYGSESPNNSYMNGRLASVMCIYALNLRGSTELASSLIGSHMAFPRFISASRSLIGCFYRSEPALVLGAHHALRTLSVLDAFSYFLQNGEIESGERGEVVARMLITHCVTKYSSDNDISRYHGLNLLSLSHFFESINLSVPSSQILENGRIHLTHWVHIPCDLQPHILLKYHYRGAAIKCKTNQRGIDFVIPVFINTKRNRRLIARLKLTHRQLDGAASLGEDVENKIKKVFSVVAVQVKNNPFSRDSETLNHLDDEVPSLLGEVCHGPPYVLHLQMNGAFKEDEVQSKPNSVGIHRQSVEAWSFSGLDIEYLRNLLTFRLMPAKDLEGDNARVLAEVRERFLFSFCDTKELIPGSSSPPHKQRKT